jgi:hypothetical protein
MVVGALVFILLLVVLVVLPLWALGLIGQYGVGYGLPVALVLYGGLVIVVLNTCARVTKFERCYGPLSVAASLASLAYLLVLAQHATIQYSSSGGGTVISAMVGYGDFIRLLCIVPAIGVVSGLLMTMQDLYYPGARLPLDFPVK